MTEKQDVKITKYFGTSQWYYLGDYGYWKVYETHDGDLFAVSTTSNKVSYDVSYGDDEDFIINK